MLQYLTLKHEVKVNVEGVRGKLLDKIRLYLEGAVNWTIVFETRCPAD
jgi:hypothetical protein